jgi:acetylornithine deacetylase/succinyl-diaminopimelate desuccinylase-like protein
MTSTETSPAVDTALAYLREHADEHIEGLNEFLRMESVSADPTKKDEVRRTAQWIADAFTAIGFDNARLTETRSNPVVTADWLHAGPDKPTVLVYCHYDVQPPDPLDEWVRPPFEPRYEDDILYARGSGDDKGQLYMHLRGAEAWLKGVGHLPLNLRVVFEGDEEHLSEPVEEFIEAHPELLAADVCIVSDSDMHDDDGTPAITYGIRGISYWEIRVQGPFQDIHSGTYGGGVDNPANVLVKMLASIVDGDGRITVPGFYDKVRDLTDADREAYAAVPFDMDAFMEATGVTEPMAGETGWTLPERLSGRPTFDIDGIWGGYQGDGPKTIIPGFAAAKISSRLVPDQDPREIEQMMIDHLRTIAPPTVTVTVRSLSNGAPAITPLDHPAVSAASRASEKAFGKAPIFHRSGGSIPYLPALERHTGIKSVMLGWSSPNGNFHAPNEWMPMANYRGGLDCIVYLWDEIGKMTAAEMRGD